VKLVS